MIHSVLRHIFVLLLLMPFCAAADNTSAEINAIKRAAEGYLYAESTMPTEDEARSNADNLLVSNINSFMEEFGSDAKFSPAMAAKFQYMKMKRGDNIRVFAFIAKGDLGLDLSSKKEDVPEETTGETASESAESTPESTGQEPASEPAVATAAPAPVAETGPDRSQRQVLDDLLGCKDLKAAMKLLGMFEAMHKVKKYGTITDVPSGNDHYWIVGTAGYNIDCIITNGESPADYKTGQPRNANDIKGVPMLWFTLR